MIATNYNPTTLVSAKRKKAKSTIAIPRIVTKDTGIHAVQTLMGERFRLWYFKDGKKQYVTLPSGITREQARSRRDVFFKNLSDTYGADVVKPKRRTKERKQHVIRLRPNLYIHTRPKYVVQIMGKQIAEARTKLEAEGLRDQWFRDNAHLLPEGTIVEGLKP